MRANPYREAMTVERLRDRFGRALASRYGLRIHMTAMLALVLASGVLVARVLRPVLPSMPLRYALAVTAGYLAFFAVMNAWARYVTDALRRDDDELADAVGGLLVVQQSAHSAAPRGSTHAPRGTETLDLSGLDVTPGGSSSGSSSGGGLGLDVDGEGLVAVVVLLLLALVLLVVFGAAAWCVWEAPVILGEVAFELLLASLLVRAARTGPTRWGRALLRHTWKPALAVALVSVLAGAGTQAACPTAVTMHDAVRTCVVPYFSGRDRDVRAP